MFLRWDLYLQLNQLRILTQNFLCILPVMCIITQAEKNHIEVPRSVGSGGYRRMWIATLDHMSTVLIFLGPQIWVDFHNYLWFFIYNSYFIYGFFFEKKGKLESVDRAKSMEVRKCVHMRKCMHSIVLQTVCPQVLRLVNPGRPQGSIQLKEAKSQYLSRASFPKRNLKKLMEVSEIPGF